MSTDKDYIKRVVNAYAHQEYHATDNDFILICPDEESGILADRQLVDIGLQQEDKINIRFLHINILANDIIFRLGPAPVVVILRNYNAEERVGDDEFEGIVEKAYKGLGGKPSIVYPSHNIIKGVFGGLLPNPHAT